MVCAPVFVFTVCRAATEVLTRAGGRSKGWGAGGSACPVHVQKGRKTRNDDHQQHTTTTSSTTHIPNPSRSPSLSRRQLWVALLLTALAMGAIVWLHERWWWQHRCSTHAACIEGTPAGTGAAEGLDQRHVGQLLALPPSLRASLWGSVYQPVSAGSSVSDPACLKSGCGLFPRRIQGGTVRARISVG